MHTLCDYDTHTLCHTSFFFFPHRIASYLLQCKLLCKAKIINLHKCENYLPWYLELNPKGVVPTLVVDGNPICDSAVIVKYVADELCEHSNGFVSTKY